MNPEKNNSTICKTDTVETYDYSVEAKRRPRVDDMNSFATIALKESGVENIELIEKDRNHFGYSIMSLFESNKLMKCLDDYSSYVEHNDFMPLDNLDEKDGVSELYEIIQVKNTIANRIRSKVELSLDDQMSKDELSKYRHLVKVKYVIGFNRKIADYIDSVSAKNNNFAELRKKLDDDLRIASSSVMNNDNELAGINFGYEKAPMDYIYRIVNGMRHEEAFKELMSEIDKNTDGQLSYGESTPEEDAKGVDVVLRAKISKKRDADGLFRYASRAEVAAEQFNVKCLQVDIKSTEERAASKLKENLSSENKPRNWIMWSNVYPEDFRLRKNKYGNPKIMEDENITPLFLSRDIQIDAMRDIVSVKYTDKKGNQFKPKSLDSRLDNIKQEVLKGLNRLYVNNSD